MNFQFQCSYVDANGNPVQGPPVTLQCPYKTSCTSQVSIPAGTASGTEVDIVLPDIKTAVTGLLVKNNTGQELNAAWGGNFFPHIPPGGFFAFCFPAPPQSGQITGLRFMLTQEQAQDGAIVFTAVGA